jgi:hypothetical protein
VLSQLPLESQVCTSVFMHWIALGVHEPWHAPLTHAWFTHGIAVPHWPVLPQVCTPLPEHCIAPVVQLPEHWPPEQSPPAHAWGGLLHTPLAPHVATPPDTHSVWPGVHEPPQAPLMQMYWHVVAVSQVPDELQSCCMVVLEHCVVSGVHVPVHAPVTHA